MKRTLTHVTLALAVAALLGACGSSVKLNDTPVESRTPSPVTAADGGTAGAGAAAGAVRPVQSAPAAQSQVANVSVGQPDAKSGAALPAGIPRVVYFDFDSFALRDDAKPTVEAHAKALAANRARKLVIEGHTDERGGREYNLALGQKRAEAVARSMVLLGVADSQLEAVSFGKERPAVQGSDEAAWAKNRRAELKDRS